MTRGGYNESDLVDALAEREKIKEKDAFEIVDMLFVGFTNALKNGARIEIRGFGNFVVREYEPYLGKNPKTGKQVKVASKKLPYFKTGKDLKDRLNGR
jgi:integration host factor subunit beta